jgi:hypothetical protein
VVIQIEGASYRLRQHLDLLSPMRHPAHTSTVEPPARRRGRPPKTAAADAQATSPKPLYSVT